MYSNSSSTHLIPESRPSILNVKSESVRANSTVKTNHSQNEIVFLLFAVSHDCVRNESFI